MPSSLSSCSGPAASEGARSALRAGSRSADEGGVGGGTEGIEGIDGIDGIDGTDSIADSFWEA